MSTAAKTPNYNLSQVAGSDIPDWITDYTSDMSKIDAALKENADDIATVRPDEFSEESTYAAGDYCIKDNVIYKAKTAVEAGAFDISDWTATTIFDELSGLNQNLGQILKTEEPLASTVESGISTAIASITLPPGKWILNAIAGFSPNGNGFRSFNLNEVKGSTGIMVSMLPIDSGATRVSFSTFMDIDTETVIYLNANQTSGSTLSVNGSRIDAIRVGM